MDANLLVAIVSAGAAAVGAGISLYAARLSTEQKRVAIHSAVSEWRRDLRHWASECVDVLSEAASRARAVGPQDSDALLAARTRLSGLVDRGRFILPNQNTEDYGEYKTPGFRGLRHPALDPLVASIRVIDGQRGIFPTPEKALVSMKRHFVGRIQSILAPELHNQEVAAMIRESGASRPRDPTLGGLLPDEKQLPTGAEPLLLREG